MDSASDFGSGGWGFESPLGLLNFFFGWIGQGSKFGRVVKALALGASLERGMGSNPIACKIFWSWLTVTFGGVAHSVERSVRNRQAQGSKPCSSTFLLVSKSSANGVSVTLKLPKL